MKLLQGKKFEVDNLACFLEKFDFYRNKNLILTIDEHETGADLVVYDTTDMLEQPASTEEFHSIITENGLDEEMYEIDRNTLVRID